MGGSGRRVKAWEFLLCFFFLWKVLVGFYLVFVFVDVVWFFLCFFLF